MQLVLLRRGKLSLESVMNFVKITASDKEVVRLEFDNLEIQKQLLNLQTDTPSIDAEVGNLLLHLKNN
ncbi:MAG: hypothetical protein CM15mV41_0530 [Caudoviricetes sp.]|nr:MAG: hypothetical protein CM15mV41_0530 [Caudoviricetes sp.]